MKIWKKRLSVVIMGIAILASAPPAWPGGRDVPERPSDDPGSNAGTNIPGGSPWDCAAVQSTRHSWGGISLDMVYGSDGSLMMQPAIWTDAIRVINDLLITEPPDSCPEP